MNPIYKSLGQGIPAEIVAERDSSDEIKRLFRDRQGNGHCL